MTPQRKQRLAFILIGLTGLGAAAALVLNALGDNMAFFFSPSQVLAEAPPQGRNFRLGGLVEQGSVRRKADGLTVEFLVSDGAARVPVIYTGLLPDLFREGQGVVTQGRLGTDGVFRADEVLAKHDEKYMPPEVAQALEATRPQPTTLNSEAQSL